MWFEHTERVRNHCCAKMAISWLDAIDRYNAHITLLNRFEHKNYLGYRDNNAINLEPIQ